MRALRLSFPRSWTATTRARRRLLLGLASPGVGCVFSTPLHQNLLVLALGLAGFGGAAAFRVISEPIFVAVEVQGPSPTPHHPELSHGA